MGSGQEEPKTGIEAQMMMEHEESKKRFRELPLREKKLRALQEIRDAIEHLDDWDAYQRRYQ